MSLPIQAVQTLVSSLLSGQYAPTGIGTNPPARMGPDPTRSPSSGPNPFSPSGASIDIMSALAPYFALLGLGTGGTLGGSTTTTPPTGTPGPTASPAAGPAASPAPAPGGDFLTQILTALLSPASSIGGAGGGEGGGGAGSILTPTSTGGSIGGAVQPGSEQEINISGATGGEVLR